MSLCSLNANAITIDSGKYIVSEPLPTWVDVNADAPNNESSIQYHGYNNNQASENIPENSFYTIFDYGKIYGDSACLTYGSWGDVSDEDFDRGNVGNGYLCWCRLNGENDPNNNYSYKSKWVARGAIDNNQPCWENCAHDCAQLAGHVYRWPDNSIKENLFNTAILRTADCPADSYCPGGDIESGTNGLYQCPENSHSESGSSSCVCDTKYETANGAGATIENPCIRKTGPDSCDAETEYWDTTTQTCITRNYSCSIILQPGQYIPPVYDISGTGYKCHKSRSVTFCDDDSLIENKPENSWLVHFGSDPQINFSGRSACSDIGGSYKELSDVQFDSDTIYGSNCWCNMTDIFGSTKWILSGTFENGDICGNECAGNCGDHFSWDNDFKTTLMSTITTPEPTNCPANSFCRGGEYSCLDTTTSIEKCPTEYPNSDEGATDKTKCYATLTFVTNGGSAVAVQKIYYSDANAGGYTLNTIPTTTRQNSDFIGWYDNTGFSGEPITTSTQFSGNKTLYAKWKTNIYTIKYVDENGQALTTTNPTQWVVGETQPFDLTDPTLSENLSFYAWFNDKNGFNINTSSNRITTLTLDLLQNLSNGSNTVTIYGHTYPNSAFWMTTTPMNAGEKFAFYVSNYTGTVYIDWGDGTIDIASASSEYQQHTYANAGTYRIGMSSKNMTNYDTNDTVNDDCGGNYHPTFWFGNSWLKAESNNATRDKLKRIEGNLSAVFPTAPNGTQPTFIAAFENCTNLEGPIPPELFANITGQPRKSMFNQSFYGCTKLSGEIPQNLFSGLNGNYTDALFALTFGATNLSGNLPADITDTENNKKYSGLFGKLSGAPQKCMFNRTFYNNPNITGQIPENLFGNLNGAPAPYMFTSTFYGCSGLSGSIPENLFGNINGTPATYMFTSTFYGCSGLSGSIPENLFGNINGAPAPYMFSSTFNGCSGLTGSIPQNLFGNINGTPATYMFTNTFNGCSGLTGSIPQNLFGRFNGVPAEYMFARTFENCSNLTGPIPATLFEGISGPIKHGSFNKTFLNASGLTGPIPEDLFKNVTGTAPLGLRMTFKGATNLGKDENGNATPIPVKLFQNISGTLPAVDISNSKYPMFEETFADTQYLTAPVPTELFKGITGYLSDNEAGNRSATYTAGGMANIFNNSNISTVCDAGQYQYLTGFEIDWDGHVACEMCPVEYPDSISGDNVTMKKCFTECPEAPNGGEYVSGHKYWTEDEEHIGDISSCVYKYTINYVLNGADESLNASNPTEYSSNMDSDLPISAPDEREFFGFIGWYDNAEFTGDIITNIPVGSVGNKTLYAKWDADIFNITYELDGGENYENAPATYTADSENIIFGTPTKDGYKFIHWLDENGDVITELPHGSNGDKTLTAVWARKINIHFDTNSGGDVVANVPDDIVCAEGEACKIYWTQIIGYIDAEPFRNAYSFNGWNQFANGLGYNFVYIAAPENGGIIEHNADLSHVFDLTQEQDITLYAKWVPEIYNIEYILNGGENYENAPNEYTVESDTITFGTPTKDGYNFIHWVDEHGNIITELPHGSNGNKTLTAVWETAEYQIIYDYTNGGSGCDNEYYTVGVEKEINCVPTNTGYIFNGWFDGNDNQVFIIPSDSVGDITLYAQWTPETYYIEYVLNGGTNFANAPHAYNYGSETIIDGTPTKKNFLFSGWCSYEDLTDCYDSYIIPNTATGKQTLYAKWEFYCESQKWMHIGENPDDKICLTDEKPNGPSMAIQTNDGVHYIILTNDDININKISDKKMHVQYNNETYNAHDNSIE